MNDLIERLAKHEEMARAMYEEYPDSHKHCLERADDLREAIAALSPVLPEDTQTFAETLREAKYFVEAEHMERLARDAYMPNGNQWRTVAKAAQKGLRERVKQIDELQQRLAELEKLHEKND